MPGTLYIVATPIGNLADITLRALETLRSVDLIAAEDTRVTRNLLSHYGIHTPTTPYHQHSLGRKAEQLLEMLKSGKDIAVVSDAGTPGISDPGHEIIRLAIDQGVPVVPIPGPNAIITAIVVSGLPTRRFAFDGFPPRRASERRAFFEDLSRETRTLVFYESPHRLLATLRDMLHVWGDRRIAVVREMTKVFEEIYRGSISGAIERFTASSPRGEFTLVVEGLRDAAEEICATTDIESALREMIELGVSDRDAVRQVASEYGISRREVYRRMIEMKGDIRDED